MSMVRFGISERLDEAINAFVVRLKRVFERQGALRLVIEFEVHPIDGVVPALFFGSLYEGTPESSPCGLRSAHDGLAYRIIGNDPLGLITALQSVEQTPSRIDVVIEQIDHRDLRVSERQCAALSIFINESTFGYPIDLSP